MALDDEALIDAVLAVRAEKSGLTAAETHAALVAAGHADLELSRVKKACSKATTIERTRHGEARGAPTTHASAAGPRPPDRHDLRPRLLRTLAVLAAYNRHVLWWPGRIQTAASS